VTLDSAQIHGIIVHSNIGIVVPQQGQKNSRRLQAPSVVPAPVLQPINGWLDDSGAIYARIYSAISFPSTLRKTTFIARLN